MNTKVIVGFLVLVAIAVGAYMFMGNSSPQEGVMPSETSNQASVQSLQALVAAGKPVTCTITMTNEGSQTSGTVYVANGMVRGDFTSTDTKAGTIESHMVVKDTTSYMWTSLSTQGFKSTITSEQKATNTTKSVDYSTPGEYKCSSWSVDSSKFDLPSAISFTSTAAFVPPSQGAGATGAAPTAGMKGTAEQCGACAQLPSAQKAQCLAALSC